MTTKSKIVTLHKKQLTTTSEIIAENCGIQHKNALALIRKYIDKFQKFSPVAFETRQGKKLPQGGFAPSTEIAILNEPQATFLITLFRNTDIVIEFKSELVAEFWRMRELLSTPIRQFDIQEKRDAHSPMMDALIFAREAVGKETTEHHFSNENLFCNRALTSKWEALDESDLDVYDLRLLKAIRNHNMVLMQYNLKQSERQNALDKYVTAYRAKKPRLKLVSSK